MSNDLEAAIEAAKAGNKSQAAKLLSRYVTTHPDSPAGWLWLGRCLEDPQRRRYCFERALYLDPQNPDARQELQAEIPAPTPAPVAPPSPQPAPQIQPPAPIRRPFPFFWLVVILAILTLGGLIVAGVYFYNLTMQVIQGQMSYSLPTISIETALAAHTTVQPSPTLGLPTYTPTVTPIRRNTTSTVLESSEVQAYHQPVPTIRQKPSPIATSIYPTFTPPGGTPQADIYKDSPQWQAANQAYNAENYSEAIFQLNEAIALFPTEANLYYLRASSYYKLTDNQRSMQEYSDYLNRALSDIDLAVALNAADSTFYRRRADIYAALAAIYPYQADAVPLYHTAVENLRMVEAPPADEVEKYRYMAEIMIYALECREAQQIIDRLLYNYPEGDAGLFFLNGAAKWCVGDIQAGLENMEKSDQMQPGSQSSNYKLALALYYTYRRNEAMQQIDNALQVKPAYNGYRYFLRALLFIDKSEFDLAEADLQQGLGNTWVCDAFCEYVQGRLFIHDGDRQAGIEHLQAATAKIDYDAMPFLPRLKMELAEYGAEVLQPTTSVQYITTPLPISQMPHTATPPAANHPNFLLTEPIVHHQVVDMSKGTGPLKLQPYQTLYFRFKPLGPVPVKTVKKFVFHLISPTKQKGAAPVTLHFFLADTGWWAPVKPVWGNSQIQFHSNPVCPEGDVYFGLANNADKTVSVLNVSATIEVETTDGGTVRYGLYP